MSGSGEGETVWDNLEKESSRETISSTTVPSLVACIKELKQLVEAYEQTKRGRYTDHEARLKALEGK